MPTFRLVSTAAREALAVEFSGINASAAINAATHACLEEADLWQEGDYVFTLRKHTEDGKFWVIHRKPELSNERERLV